MPSNKSKEVLTPKGYSLVHQKHIYQDLDLGREHEKLETKEEKRRFLIAKEERGGCAGYEM